jgi:FKBP-type peptidyl-prolyl cis-trans isomerase FklB
MRFFGLIALCLCLAAVTVWAQAPGTPAGKGAPAAAAPAAGRTLTQQAAPAADANPTTVASYGIGMNIGRSLKSDGVEVAIEAFMQGLQDALADKQSAYTEDQLRTAFGVLQRQQQAKKAEADRTAGDKNEREGTAFLAANKGKPGVVTTASGLQYQVLRSGKGASPKATDTVRVHYEGKLLDGSVFDSSIKRNEPAEFPVNGVIPGWTEALQLMKVGDKWQLFIPAKLAYGARGAGEAIGPNSVLTFEVELLEIRPAK